MRVLLLGLGARAHALTERLLKSGDEIWCTPMVELWRSDPRVHAAPIHPELGALATWAADTGIELVVGLDEYSAYDDAAAYFRARGIVYFGPTRAAAHLEQSKLHARRLLEALGFELPALLRIATDPNDAVAPEAFPVVLRLDSSASARGVRFAKDAREFADSFNDLVRVHATSGSTERFGILVEEYVAGFEVTFAVFAGRKSMLELPPVRDYKYLEEGDRGPLTSGMGGYSPVPALAPGWEAFQRGLFERVLDHLEREGSLYVGYLNANVVFTNGRCVVLEFNCHMGDPDLVLLLPQIDGNIALIMHGLAVGAGHSGTMVRPKPSVAVSLAERGYPTRAARQSRAIKRPDAATERLFLFGARRIGDRLFPTGGRVLLACATSGSFREAIQGTYETAAAAQLANPALVFRRDVGLEAME
jgi:phosphoribosylamine---glycine ligase